MSDSVTKHLVEPVSSSFVPISASSSASASELQTHLKTFIRAALQQSCSGTVSVERSLELLDKAWVMQKLVWQLRSCPSSN